MKNKKYPKMCCAYFQKLVFKAQLTRKARCAKLEAENPEAQTLDERKFRYQNTKNIVQNFFKNFVSKILCNYYKFLAPFLNINIMFSFCFTHFQFSWIQADASLISDTANVVPFCWFDLITR